MCRPRSNSNPRLELAEKGAFRRVDARERAAFEALPGLQHCRIYGVEQISQFIRESPRLRMLVPRVYGLGDPSEYRRS